MCASTVTMVQIIDRRRGEGTPSYGYYIKWCPWQFAIWFSSEAVRRGRTPGDPLLPFGQFTLCRACGDETACVAARYLTLRIVRERHERKNPLPFSFSQRSPVSGLHQIILGKGRKSEGGNHWCLPSCASAGEAGFSRFASETPNFWNDNENVLKRRTIAPANSAYSFEQARPNPRTRDSDAKYKTKTEDVPVLGLQTVQTGRKKELYFRTAPQKFTSADIHLRTARQARLHARGCLLQCRSCCP